MVVLWRPWAQESMNRWAFIWTAIRPISYIHRQGKTVIIGWICTKNATNYTIRTKHYTAKLAALTLLLSAAESRVIVDLLYCDCIVYSCRYFWYCLMTPTTLLLAFCTDEIYLTALINVLTSCLVFSAAVGSCTVLHNRLLMWKQIYLGGDEACN